jgi:hypothetical protein
MWQSFLPYIQAVLDRRGDAEEAERIVCELFRACIEDVGSLEAEPRIVELAARLRHHDAVGEAARAVLAVTPHDQAIAVIERYPYDPVLPRAALPEKRDFLARYLAGERGVWNELVEQALAVVQHDELREEAHAVAVEIMKRVRHNADVVRETLAAAGARVPAEAPPASERELAQFAPAGAIVATALGPLPLALDAFWLIVGSLALAPAGPCALDTGGLVLAALEPLAIRGAREASDQLAHYEQRVAASHREIVGPLELELAEGSTVVHLPPPTPADAIDPRVHRGRHKLRFVEYLRHSFRWGGFWGLEIPHDPAATRLGERLRAGLIDF